MGRYFKSQDLPRCVLWCVYILYITYIQPYNIYIIIYVYTYKKRNVKYYRNHDTSRIIRGKWLDIAGMSPTKCGNFASSWGLRVIFGLTSNALSAQLFAPCFARVPAKDHGTRSLPHDLACPVGTASACDWHGLTSTSRGVVEACPGWYWSELTCWNCLDYASNMFPFCWCKAWEIHKDWKL